MNFSLQPATLTKPSTITGSRIRFRRSLSKNLAEEGFLLHKELINYIEKHYFEQVDQLDCRVIYKDRLPEAKPVLPSGDVGFPNVHDCTHYACVAWDIWRRGLDADLCGYDTVTTISQASINEHFAALFRQHHQASWKGGVVLSEWSYTFGNEVFFKAVYDKAPRIQLVFSEPTKCKAVLYLFVKEGHLKVVHPDVTLPRGERLKARWVCARLHPIVFPLTF
jgi:hypothetical protein